MSGEGTDNRHVIESDPSGEADRLAIGWCGEAAQGAGVAILAGVAVHAMAVHLAELGIDLSVAIDVERKLEHVLCRCLHDGSSFAGDDHVPSIDDACREPGIDQLRTVLAVAAPHPGAAGCGPALSERCGALCCRPPTIGPAEPAVRKRIVNRDAPRRPPLTTSKALRHVECIVGDAWSAPVRHARRVDVGEIVRAIMHRPGLLRLVAIDGPGGAGKSTLAGRVAHAAHDAPVTHTDDFASADNPINWWPRLLEQVINPLVRGDAATYQRYDWSTESLAEWHTIEPAPIIIIEGVTAGRAEWRRHLSFLIWIDTPREERLRRAVARDGPEALDDWRSWMADEDAHYARDPTRERADVLIDGTVPNSRVTDPRS